MADECAAAIGYSGLVVPPGGALRKLTSYADLAAADLAGAVLKPPFQAVRARYGTSMDNVLADPVLPNGATGAGDG